MGRLQDIKRISDTLEKTQLPVQTVEQTNLIVSIEKYLKTHILPGGEAWSANYSIEEGVFDIVGRINAFDELLCAWVTLECRKTFDVTIDGLNGAEMLTLQKWVASVVELKNVSYARASKVKK